MNLRKFKFLVRLVKKELLSISSFEIAKNNVYSKEEYLDAFLYLTQRQSAHSGSSQLKYIDEHTPNDDSMLYTIKKMSVDKFHDMLTSITDKLLELCFRLNIFRRDYEFDIAIDFHERPYYGDKDDEGVVGGKKEPHWVYKFATIDIIERGCTFTIFTLPLNEVDLNRDIVDTLLTEAKRRIRINCLYADAEFMGAELMDVYLKHDISYIIRAKSKYVYKIEKLHQKSTSFEYTRKRYANKNPVYTKTTWVINVFEQDDKTKKESYYTNLKVTKRNIDYFHLQYDKRWNIEIDYRTNNNFMARTCSKKYVVRAFYFFLCVIMRNVLTYMNLRIKQEEGLWHSSKPLISSYNFVFLIALAPYFER